MIFSPQESKSGVASQEVDTNSYQVKLLTKIFIGTSMSTPFVAGFASYVATYLKTTDPAKIKAAIDAASTHQVVTNAKTAHNNLPYDHLADTLKYLIGNLR
ncbi:MAG: S8 family serine peptidase [bacterium]|nr:S8 family serine peptidase [bacterium]